MTMTDTAARLPPALVLNADFQPLSLAPLSLWAWQDAVRAVFQDRVAVVRSYDGRAVRSPTFAMALPSIVALRDYRRPPEHAAFTRMNLRLRDRHACVYCGARDELTFDHVRPRSRGHGHGWENTVLACVACNQKKGDRRPEDVGLRLPYAPYRPTTRQLEAIARRFPPRIDTSEWQDFLYWSVPLEE